MKRPNIILFVTDQQMVNTIGCYGSKICKTPNLDSLAREGMQCMQNYTACPLCSPARTCILTGKEVHKHGVTANVHEIGCNCSEIVDSPELLSHMLKNGGYNVGYTGKWHIGAGRDESYIGGVKLSPATPLTRGFEGQCTPEKAGWLYDDFRDYLKKLGLEDQIANYDKHFRTDDGEQLVVEHKIEGTCEYFLSENTIGLIDKYKQDDKPFFIWHNTWGPHGAYICHKDYYDLYKDVHIPKPLNFGIEKEGLTLPSKTKRLHGDEDWEYFEQDMKLYYALITQIDAMLGRIINHLKEKGIYDNTVIIFTSDHGSHFGMHGGLIDKGFSHYEEAQRTACIVFNPKDKNHREITKYTGLIDIYPTILDFAGVEIPKTADGQSLLDIERGREFRDHAFVEFYGLGNILTTMLTIVYDGCKYGWNPTNRDELYDLGKDPLESHNIIDDKDYADKLKVLREKMYYHLKEHNNVLQYMYRTLVLQYYYPSDYGKILR